MKEFFTNYILSIPNQFQLRIKILYTNGEIEYIGLTFTLLNFGIQHLISPTYSPKKDETAERKHLHVPDTTLNLFHHASIPLKFFFLVFQSEVYLTNRLLTPLFGLKSLF